VIWVWTTKAASKGVSVKATMASARYIGQPKFTVCPLATGTTCKIGSLPLGQADELQATVAVQARASVGEHVKITAKASAAGAASFAGSATEVVQARPTSSPSPLGTLPVPGTVPTISGTGISPTNPSGLFPTVGTTPSTGTGPLTLPPARSRPVLHAATVAARVPLDARLISAQLAGLAALATAVVIAIARLSLRKPKASGDSDAKPPDKQ
jgi:hypothetical protein